MYIHNCFEVNRITNVRGRAQKRRLIYINTSFNSVKVPGLVDTGSELSCIDPSLVEKLGLSESIYTGVPYTVKGAFDQKEESPLGEVDLPFKIGRTEYVHTFTVTPLANTKSIILGLDFFELHNYHLSYEEGFAALSIDGTRIPVIPRMSKGINCNIVSLEPVVTDPKPQEPDNEAKVFRRIVIPALSTALVKVYLPEKTPLQTDVCIEMKNTLPEGIFFPDVRARVLDGAGHNKHGKHCISKNNAPSTCPGCSPYKYTVIRIRNTSGGNIVLPMNCSIGTVSAVIKAKKAEVKRAFHITVKDNATDYNDPKRLRLIMSLLGDRCPDRPHLVGFIQELFAKFPEIIHLKDEKLRVTDLIQHHINYDGNPIWVRQHPIPQVKMAGLLESIDKLLTHASLVGTDSPYNFPAVPVYKKELNESTGQQTVRLTVDYTKLNEVCPKDRVSLGTWDEFITALDGSCIFSKFDMRSSYHQIPLTPDSIEKTAFTINNRRYAYSTVPQGLSNSPATLARLLNMVFSNLQDQVCVYLDDFLAHSANIEDHKVLLTEICSRLSKAKLQLAIEKCEFFCSSASFLGFLIDKNGIHPDPAKTAPLAKKAPPKTVHEVRSTLGMFGVFRRHIRNYADITRPISELTKGVDIKKGKSVPIVWTAEADEAFKKLKEATLQHVVLKFPNYKQPFFVYCDASGTGIGGYICQYVDDEGPPRPIAFYSRVLKDSERNYSTIDREALAIVHVLSSARAWIIGYRIILKSDHKPLQFIAQNCSKNSRLNRWRTVLQEFSPELEYVKGEQNEVADWLSRYSHQEVANRNSVAMEGTYVKASLNSPLPRAVPETFTPERSQESLSQLCSKDLKGTIICLSDCMSREPKGPLATLSEKLPYVKDYFDKRQPYQPDNIAPFCSEDSAATLGTLTTLSGGGPEVILIHHTLYEITSADRKVELQEIRQLASPALAERFRTSNAIERHFYAHLALDALLTSWSKRYPENVIICYPKLKDRHNDYMIELLDQFAFGASQIGAKAVAVGLAPEARKEFQINNVIRNTNCSVNIQDSNEEVTPPWTTEDMVKAQDQQNDIHLIKTYLSNKSLLSGDDFKAIEKLPLDRFIILNDLIYHQSVHERDRKTALQLFVPQNLIKEALRFGHITLAGHGGVAKTLYLMRRHFYWPQLHADTTKYILGCVNCVRTKPAGPDQIFKGKLFMPYNPLDCIAIDVLGVGRKSPRGHKYVLVAIDSVTRYAWAFPLKTRETKEIVDKLNKNLFLIAGLPRYLVCDRAAEFTAAQMKEVLHELAVTQKLCTTFNPTSNSAAERLNRTLLQLLRSLLFDQDEKHWDDLLPLCMYFYNVGYHKSLDNSPFYLYYGRDPNVPYDAILSPVPHHDGKLSDRAINMARCLRLAREAIVNTQNKAMAIANAKSKNKIDIGDLVFVRERYVSKKDHKLLPKYGGPLRVVDLLGPPGTPGACVLKSLRTGRTKQVSLKDVKLLQNYVATKTENDNVGEAFPTFGNGDIPDAIPSIEISRHGDIQPDVIDDVVAGDVIESDEDEPITCVSNKVPLERSMPAKDPKEDTPITVRYSKPGTDTYGTPNTAVRKRVARTGGGNDVTPVATRTRARSKACETTTTRNIAIKDNAPGVVTRSAKDRVDQGITRPKRIGKTVHKQR